MMRQQSSRSIVHALAVVTVVLVVLPIVPLIYAASSSPDFSLFAASPLDGHTAIFARGLVVQLWLTLFGTIFITTLVLGAGYGMSLLSRTPKVLVGVFFLIPAFIRGGLIPSYILVRSVGLIDHPLALALGEPMDVLLIVVAAVTLGGGVSVTLREAASVDGAHPLTAMIAVVLPAHPSLLTTLVVLSALRFWNAWFPAFLYIHSRSLVPAQNVLRSLAFRSNSGIASGLTRDAAQIGEQRIALYAIALLIPGLLLVRFFRGAAMAAIANSTKRGKK